MYLSVATSHTVIGCDCNICRSGVTVAATLNFSRLGARAVISKTAKNSAKMYLKSAVAGHDLDAQAAGQMKPMFARNPSSSNAAAPGRQSAVAMAGSFSGPRGVGIVGGGSNTGLVAQPYPAGSSAAAAASGLVARDS